MTLYYVCKGCGETIYIHRKKTGDSFGIPTPTELKGRVTSKCPRCGRELGTPSINDIIIMKKS